MLEEPICSWRTGGKPFQRWQGVSPGGFLVFVSGVDALMILVLYSALALRGSVRETGKPNFFYYLGSVAE